MLNEAERRTLEAIEQHLLSEDPALAEALQRGPEGHRRRRLTAAAWAAVALGAVIASLGILLLSFGLITFGCLVTAGGWLGYRYATGAPTQSGGIAPG